MKRITKYMPLLAIIILLILCYIWDVQKYFNVVQLKENQIALENFIQQNTISAALIYSIIYITITGASIPGATFLTIAGGFLFGQVIGTISVVISATLGATIIFLSTKLASKDLIQKKAGPWFKKILKGFKANQISYLLSLRLIPLFPFVAVNLVCAILNIPLKIFFLTTLLGIIPGSFVYVSLGVAMHEVINQPNFAPDLIINSKILIALVGLGILTLLPVLYKYVHRKR